ncbi:MAG: hypothetical protein PUB51_06875, partial [Oscillospiraceae bacterium]|nr:hypothetical protein [Oscillospiraceae bacterium]
VFFLRHMSSEKTDFTLFRHLRMTELCEALALRAGKSGFFDSLTRSRCKQRERVFSLIHLLLFSS